MTNESRNPFDELEVALNVEPSPVFAAKVRQALPARATRYRQWFLALGLAAAASVMFVISRDWHSRSTPVDVARVERASDEVPPLVPAGSGKAPVATPIGAARVAAHAGEFRSKRPRPFASTSSSRVVSEPAVLVSPDVLAGLEQLRARISDGTLDAGVIPLADADEPERLRAPVAIPGEDQPGAQRLHLLSNRSSGVTE